MVHTTNLSTLEVEAWELVQIHPPLDSNLKPASNNKNLSHKNKNDFKESELKKSRSSVYTYSLYITLIT